MDSKENLEQAVQDVTGVSSSAPAPAVQGNDVVFRDKPKKSKGMMFGMILFAILAAGGIGFGAWAMMDGNAKLASKDEEITTLKSQISELNDKLAEQTTSEEETETEDDDNTAVGLNDEIVLNLLQKDAVDKQLGYEIENANVYAECTNSNGVEYWVKYQSSNNVSGDVMFQKSDDDEWKFELPGFTGYGPDLLERCTILHGDKQ